jgi:hypothetical protein
LCGRRWSIGRSFVFGSDFVRVLTTVSLGSMMISSSLRTESFPALGAGSVSIGFMQATPGDMKSLRSSAERRALIVSGEGGMWRAPAAVDALSLEY